MHQKTVSYTFDKFWIIREYNNYILGFINSIGQVFDDDDNKELETVKQKADYLITDKDIELKDLAQTLCEDEGFMDYMFGRPEGAELGDMGEMLITDFSDKFITKEWVASRQTTREAEKTIDEHDKP